MDRRSRRACPSAPWAIASAALLALGPCAWAQGAAPPRVGAQLIIDSAQLAGALGDERKATVEAAVSAWLAVEAQRSFGFLSWVAAAGADPPPAHRWVVRLQDDAAAALATGTSYFFRFFKITGGGPEIALESLGTAPFDSDRNPFLPTDNAEVFVEAVEKKLKARFDEDFKKRLSEAFLYTITLTSELEVNEEAQALILPFTFRDLKASSASKVRVTFAAPLSTTAFVQSGELELGAVACLARPDVGERIRGEIRAFRFDPTPVAVPCLWDSSVAEILKSATPGSRAISMKEYFPDEDGSEDPCRALRPVITGP